MISEKEGKSDSFFLIFRSGIYILFIFFYLLIYIYGAKHLLMVYAFKKSKAR